MSKSKRNTVDPQYIIDTYGADAARLFMLSDSPPERDLEWTDAGIEGAWRYLNRLWRMAIAAKDIVPGALPATLDRTIDPKADAVRRQIHRAIAAVSDDLEKFRFNSAVARVRELTNAIADLDRSVAGGDAVYRFGMEVATQLINPLTPHIAEEIWKQLGHTTLLVETPWPQYDPTLLQDDTVTMAVQVNGKLRDTITVPRGADQAACTEIALASMPVQRQLGGKGPRKVIFVPGKIVNIIAA
jgi:leucyl-tRNA synthetase